MAKFNEKALTEAQSTATVNLAGGEAYQESARLEFVSLVLTSFVKNQYYRKDEVQVDRARKLVDTLVQNGDGLFAAKAAIYARNEFGMRSISHVAAAAIVNKVKGPKANPKGVAAPEKLWTRRFVSRVVRRVDDATEILALTLADYGKPLPNALKDGIAEALGKKFDTYQLGKYRAEGKKVTLLDAVRIAHPHPTERSEEGLTKLVEGTLTAAGTWEASLSATGEKTKDASEEEKVEAKGDAWGDLIREKKLGYMALLKNLVNILEAVKDVGLLEEACLQLTDREAIKRSLVLPFRYMTAMEEVEALGSDAELGLYDTHRRDTEKLARGKNVPKRHFRMVQAALTEAMEIAVDNAPEFDGETLVAIDSSGSMQANKNYKKAAIFAAALGKKSPVDICLFDYAAKGMSYNPADSISTLAKQVLAKCNGGISNFNAPFEWAKKAYDRIIIISDMQGWVGHRSPVTALKSYNKRTGANPNIYSLDLSGYGTLEFPESQVYALAGFSDRLFDIMKTLEQDRLALIHTIESVVL
jgi:hypothetical protein